MENKPLTETDASPMGDSETKKETEELHTDPPPPQPLATAAALDSSTFSAYHGGAELPATWEERARRAWDYYLTEPIVSSIVNAWRIFAIGDEISVLTDDEQLDAEIASFAKRVKLSDFVKDATLQLLCKGESICFMQVSRDGKEIRKLININPISVKPRYENGELVEATQYPDTGGNPFAGADSQPIDIPVERVIHLKWNAPAFSPRGNSLLLPAFESIELLRDYRRAERAIAKRWTSPMRFIQVGGQFGQKTIIPDQKTLNSVRDMVNRMDLKAGLVVPFYVKAETYGTEGEVLNTEDKVREVKEDIMVALGMARALVSGDGPNFATASISFHKMIILLKEIKQHARKLLDWVFDEWKMLHGYEDKKFNYHFNDLDLNNEVDRKKLLIEMYDRGLISAKTLQRRMGLDPDIERNNRRNEVRLVDRSWDIKDVVSLVSLGILTTSSARGLLGIDDEEESKKEKDETMKDIYSLYNNAFEKLSIPETDFFEEPENISGEDTSFIPEETEETRDAECECGR